MGTCSGIIKPGMSVELVGSEILVAFVVSIFSVVSVLSLFGFGKTGVVCFLD